MRPPRSSERRADPALLILTSLAGGPRHGYAIIQDVLATGGPRLGPGTLYGALARLESRGLVEPVSGEDRRRPYRITCAGAGALRRQLDSMESIVRVARLRLAEGVA